MKYLVCGDIHGNLPALEKILQQERGNFDALICHGDIVNYGPWSNECIDFLESCEKSICLKGNHEQYFISGEYPGENLVARSFFDFCYPMFERALNIKKYGDRHVIGRYIVQHTIENRYIFPDSEISDLNLKNSFIIGHSHHQFDRSIGIHRLVNTGSVGQNRAFINVSNYVMYDDVCDSLELKHLIFDIDQVIQEMRDMKYPEICIDYYNLKKRAAVC